MKLQTADVVVIGGGAIGAAAAFYLAKAGKRVTLVERAGLAREASGANVGLVTLFSGHSLEEPDPGPVYALTRASVDAYESLGEEVGMNIEYEQCGGVVWTDSEEKLRLIRRAREGYAGHGVPVEWLDAAGVRECEPAFYSDRILGGAFCALNGQVNPLLLTRALARGAVRSGARLLLGTTVQGITIAGQRVQAVQTSAGEIPCEFVVNAAGAWAAEIGAMAGIKLPVFPARGQILLTEAVPRFIRRVVSGAEPAARQTQRGNVIIGSTVENVGFDKTMTPATIDHFAREILPYFPRLRGLNVIRAWAGLRPATPDSKPIIELMAEPQGLCLANGHSRRGICYAAGTGQLVAQLITGKTPFLPLDSFRLSRFEGEAFTSGRESPPTREAHR
jgi:D-hydroxyproline dehydrogenase subunit beta